MRSSKRRTAGHAVPSWTSVLAWAGIAGFLGALPGVALAAPPKEEPRTLDEITIEGEIAMPQVLFITAREPYRFADLAHRVYLPRAEAARSRATVPVSYWMGRALTLSIAIPSPADGPYLPPEGKAAPSPIIESRGRN